MTPDKDGWINHDGGPCPVGWETWVQPNHDAQRIMRALEIAWGAVARYRIFAPVEPKLDTPPGPSPFVAETAAKIVAAMAARDYRVTNMPHEWVGQAVHTAIMLEKALRDAAP